VECQKAPHLIPLHQYSSLQDSCVPDLPISSGGRTPSFSFLSNFPGSVPFTCPESFTLPVIFARRDSSPTPGTRPFLKNSSKPLTLMANFLRSLYALPTAKTAVTKVITNSAQARASTGARSGGCRDCGKPGQLFRHLRYAHPRAIFKHPLRPRVSCSRLHRYEVPRHCARVHLYKIAS